MMFESRPMGDAYYQMTHRPEVLQDAYWKRPNIDHSTSGDSEVAPIYLAVGEALSMWEQAECSLATMYQIMCCIKDSSAINAVLRAFGSIESSAGQREALTAVAEIHFGHYWNDASKYFKALMQAFSNGAKRRDEFAHGMAYGLALNGRHLGCYLLPAAYNTLRNNPYMSFAENGIPIGRAKYFYTSSMIREFTKKFGQLNGETWTYLRRISLVNGVPAFVLDALHGEGSAEKITKMIETAKKD
jgi:hypothetical protein